MKKLGFLACVPVVVTSVAIAAATFSDVPTNHIYGLDIEEAVRQGWFQGYGDGTFRPDKEITTNQLATVIKRAFPDGATRAEVASFMVGGYERMNNPPRRQIQPPSQDSGAWERFSTTNEFDDTPIIGYTLNSIPGENAYNSASIMVRCYGNRPDIAVLTTEYVAGRNDRLPVRFRAAKAKARTEVWLESTSNKALWRPDNLSRGEFLRYIINNPEKFLFEWTDFSDDTTVYRWANTRGLDVAAKELYDICGM